MSDSAKWYVIHTYSGYENAVKTAAVVWDAAFVLSQSVYAMKAKS